MWFFSLKNSQYRVEFKEALSKGLATDKGLFFPEQIPKISKNFINNISEHNLYDITFEVIYPYVTNTITKEDIKKIIRETLSFPFPIKAIKKDIYALELFHGPTLSFKDIGAKFMAGCINYFKIDHPSKITVLVATSGDTGGAVANGFYKVPNVKVLILYPSKKVSPLQELQLTTLGENVSAIEVEGDFDDCQSLVKSAFLDEQLQKKITLTSANSINIARWLPQMIYYFIAYRSLIGGKSNKKIVFSVPSGNFGNLCAGMMTSKMGLPIEHFIASTNINDTVPRFMHNGIYSPRESKATISNAMDVADPSNFVRILHLHPYYKDLQKYMTAYSFSDYQTIDSIQKIWKNTGYMLDPHGAVAYLGLEQYFNKKGRDSSTIGVFLATAHPGKFVNKFPKKLRSHICIPDTLKTMMKKNKKRYRISKDYSTFKSYLLEKISI
ncbi:MAG: threonine synthase [Candidatus Walczuchella monophlebidarum]